MVTEGVEAENPLRINLLQRRRITTELQIRACAVVMTNAKTFFQKLFAILVYSYFYLMNNVMHCLPF